jgi:hypothetical protein
VDAPRAVLGVFFFFGRAVFAVLTDPREPDEEDPLLAPPTRSRPKKLWTPEQQRR